MQPNKHLKKDLSTPLLSARDDDTPVGTMRTNEPMANKPTYHSIVVPFSVGCPVQTKTLPLSNSSSVSTSL